MGKQILKKWVALSGLSAAIWTGSMAWVPVLAADTAANRVLTVSGHGEVQVVPDVAYIQLGLVHTAPTAKQAQQENASGFTKIVNVLKGLHIPDKDIQTVRYFTSPDYSFDGNKQTLKGYQVEQIIQITYRDLNNIGTILDKTTAAGVNRVDNVQFGSEKLNDYEQQALARAIANAKEKAAGLAKNAGVKLQSIIQINEGTSQPLPISPGVVMGGGAGISDAKPITQVFPGQLKVQDTVTLTYAFN
ncbi:SIMPL domain-containing protein [Aneurinibacillus sp. Ricciae_BoGa-3]|uniref:SIMPL domain-containing protein n=1 Tax=Aneurinibacillus sp. Ricciae_BoGa-3 TaxID=3022697 RepID=UPI002340ACEA|nr:SIMPL domain-containing protein [Aneurinibacillus sp. Ricciae_BoGa-3]WCK56552.1 SIMPL domain-containing protein [Aneurinibacillus sp. Ricciae_BoGa-3]